MQNDFNKAISNLLTALDMDISAQFLPKDSQKTSVLKSLNSSFLIILAGENHPLFNDAKAYMETFSDDSEFASIFSYYEKMLSLIESEISLNLKDEIFKSSLSSLSEIFSVEGSWRVFFPQACDILEDKKKKIKELRSKRKVNISSLNKNPINDISKEMLFTSNILITTPDSSQEIESLGFSENIKEKLKEVIKEEQKFWYDHPIQMGVELERNEAVYGLVGLDEAVGFEKKRGVIESDSKIDCLLSVSVTHEGLKEIAKEYLEDELKKLKGIKHLNIYVITEADSEEIIEEILKPKNEDERALLLEIFGVDGEYGRHYSLLKAIAAFWQVLVSRDLKATFKFDLDQIFPQKELVEQGGMSAFEHFKTPLWGAKGVDSSGDSVDLGMLAGALVNQKDIDKSLFHADVPFPTSKPKGSQFVFNSSLPQALSTEAEMMLRYDSDEFDGKSTAALRIHVTGGTNGILVDSLRKHRPFTPTFIGRAEDQAYILSTFFKSDCNLRYLHKPALIMRHDKEAFAQEAIEAAYVGKLVGDYVRILYFSYYVKALPYDKAKLKDSIDPFTGSFVSDLPFTVVALRMALEAANFFENDQEKKGLDFLELGSKRVSEVVELLSGDENYLKDIFNTQKSGWDLYYDRLDEIQERDDEDLKQDAAQLVKKLKIMFV